MHCTHQMAVNAGRGPQTAVALGGVTESRMPFYLAPNRSNKSPRDGKKKETSRSQDAKKDSKWQVLIFYYFMMTIFEMLGQCYGIVMISFTLLSDRGKTTRIYYQVQTLVKSCSVYVLARKTC